MANPAATLTIRKLDEAVKRQLRRRAAEHDRSMEDEARSILGRALGGAERSPAMLAPAAETPPAPAAAFPPSLAQARILLIVGGGIAAYKSLDLIRRLRERGAAVRAVMTKGGQEFVTPLS